MRVEAEADLRARCPLWTVYQPVTGQPLHDLELVCSDRSGDQGAVSDAADADERISRIAVAGRRSPVAGRRSPTMVLTSGAALPMSLLTDRGRR